MSGAVARNNMNHWLLIHASHSDKRASAAADEALKTERALLFLFFTRLTSYINIFMNHTLFKPAFLVPLFYLMSWLEKHPYERCVSYARPVSEFRMCLCSSRVVQESSGGTILERREWAGDVRGEKKRGWIGALQRAFQRIPEEASRELTEEGAKYVFVLTAKPGRI